MAENFRAARKFRGPGWVTGENGEEAELVGYSLELLRDASVRRVEAGLLARFPQQDPDGTPGHDAALAEIGRDRRILRGIGETSRGYAARLIPYKDHLRRRGSAYAMLQQLTAYVLGGSTGRTVDRSGNWCTIDAAGEPTWLADPGSWDWDSSSNPERAGFWANFWVVLYPGTTWSEGPAWGDADLSAWGSTDRTWGSTASPGEAASVRHLVRDWKPNGTRCVGAVIAFDTGTFDPTAAEPDGVWGRWSRVVNGVRVAARVTTARYVDV